MLPNAKEAGKRQTDTGKTATVEETDTAEKADLEKDIIDLPDVPSEKQDTPR